MISFILSLIAYSLPNWKHVQLRSTSIPTIISENNQIDPLIRSEVDKYYDVLYRRGGTHSYGLLSRCIAESKCGRNLLPSYHETNYGLCHNIKHHNQCIFSNSLSVKKCTCQKPSYISITHTLLILILILQVLFISVNLLRLYCHHCQTSSLNDVPFRLIGIILTLISLLFLIIIIIQQNSNRFIEPLEFFQSMHRHYLRTQIYKFSSDLHLIIKQLEHDLDIRFGISYICIIFVLIITFICFITSSTVEIKTVSKFDEDEKINEQNPILIEAPPIERFAPFEQTRFTRQTKV
ncbi:unnamed protein product [Rotaria sp. Silwood2]|nr:unnamed protein product [Rotaria sp. Silwood2]CAF2688957.1 unnamed protein product [Rotaria sp. Silwood2]CAF2934059.1 unnamed protein product [Rotaria sp. Silwood2]CAF3098684.1 unnamed protein product [Rotaria sp. Silwood2]CAF3863845.1 unnamed protein product [Rotaria sp. Silwood2]